jgi:hypothetical protein
VQYSLVRIAIRAVFDWNKAVVQGYQVKPGVIKPGTRSVAKCLNSEMAPSNEFAKWSEPEQLSACL